MTERKLLRRLQLVREIAAGRWWWKRFVVGAINRDGFVNDDAKLIEDGALVVTMAGTKNQTRRAADVGLIFL